MAKLLYRLGLLAAKRAKTIVAAWFAALLVAGAAYMGFGGQLTDQMTMPDLETTRVADRLADEIPDASGSSASVILRTDDGSEFTQEQEQAVADLIEEVEQHDIVDSVTDPFVTATELADAQQELADGRDELESGEAELADGRDELEAGEEQLAEGREELEANAEQREQLESGLEQLDEADAQLDAAVEQALAEGTWAQQEAILNAQRAEIVEQREPLESALAQMEAAEEQLESGEQELAEAREELEQGEAELEDAAEELERGERSLQLSEGLSMVSDEGDVSIMMISLNGAFEDMVGDDLSALADELTSAEIDGVEVLPSSDLTFEMPHLFSIAEVIGLIIAAVVLLVMLGTFIGAGLPLINAMVGVGVGVATAMAFSGAVEMMSMTPILGLMLGLAVGIDYALFILHRHRKQLRAGMPLIESIALANGTAGNAVVFAGATVVIALLGLNVTGIPFLGLMGTVAAFCVLVAVLMATTMTPALLKLVGNRILRRSERRHVGASSKKKEFEAPIGAGRAVALSFAALAGLAVLAIPALDLRLGLPDGSADPEDSVSYQAYMQTEDSFGQGMNGPLMVVADLPEDADGVSAEDRQLDIAEALVDHQNIATALPITLSDDETMAAFQVVPEEGPSAVSTEELVHEFRDGDPLSDSDIEGVELSVAGITAAQIDISDVITDSLPLYLALVVGLSLVLMIMVFRSLLLPLVATLGFVGSLVASIGVVVAVFQWGWLSDVFGVTTPGPILTFLPILMVGILFGLAMDYQLFTASGMREAYTHGAPPRIAVRRGLHAGRAVVTAAALIMASVFAGFVFTPDPMIASIGLGLAVGVLLDAFVVRLLLVPAVLSLAGPAAWWLPKWLDRILPDVDVEGAALERAHAQTHQGAGI